ncbi:uncharacterized protein Z520_11160 [Fonsecaea multimorphosa CBS 102226]|uniref:Uncharacterized protein n=1 Tax=Fonsecaea multimorphosa CBS 102226 TaxID=1442371 RepID=A0A0D2K9N3_9EURO|nr:uncharacterized protein Z520_11160 [Fonsecaea multimorphosa CBS 102226]KIX93103.1 hypothetical protein Z520_11160 [Fonsecaea multimorphosa CBS 102226]OAL18401.1 hypothetical protein AYO22_10721 [Fonsecaea multimorphosa]
MLVLFEDQRKIARTLEQVVRGMDKPDEDESRDFEAVTHGPGTEVAEQTSAVRQSPPPTSPEPVVLERKPHTRNRRKLVRVLVQEETQQVSKVWGASSDPQDSSLPLSKIQLSIDEIEKMIQRATKAQLSLNVLVDLKQKQINVLEARATRRGAEETLRSTNAMLQLNKAAEKQGDTVMVFTVVAIIFLPLSFMAAFFAIDISEFARDRDGALPLGWVSAFMFPISLAVSAALIFGAFKVQTVKKWWIFLHRSGTFQQIFFEAPQEGDDMTIVPSENSSLLNEKLLWTFRELVMP